MPVFEFVDPDDPSARTKAKSHVARKAHREKRLREIESYQGRLKPVPQLGGRPGHARTSTAGTPPWAQPIRPLLGKELTLRRHAERQTASAAAESATASDGDTTTTEYSDEQSEDPSTWIDTYASRVGARPPDSFWTAYLRLDAGDRNLLQWYLIKLPELTFDIVHAGPLNPMRDWVFPLLGNNLAVLHSSLLIGAVNNPSCLDGDKGTSHVLIQRGRTINLINQGLQRGSASLSDDILYAVAATAVAEDRLGNHAACRTHLDGLKHMIRLRGGIPSLRKNPALCAALTWAEVSVSNHSAPLPPSSRPSEGPHRAKMTDLAMLEARLEEQMFCRFLNELQRVQLSKRRSHTSADHHALEKTDFLFRKGSPLLAMLGESGLDPGLITPNSRMNAYNCQIACLFYINFMLCELYGFAHRTAAFLVRLSSLLRQHSPDKAPRASLFVWVFIKEIEKDGGGAGKVDPLEWLIQMMRVARRLSHESIQILHQALLQSLKTHEPVDAGILVSNDLDGTRSRKSTNYWKIPEYHPPKEPIPAHHPSMQVQLNPQYGKGSPRRMVSPFSANDRQKTCSREMVTAPFEHNRSATQPNPKRLIST